MLPEFAAASAAESAAEAALGSEPGSPQRLQDPLQLRASPRVAVDLPASLEVSGLAGPLPARARDVGIGGLCVATASPFALGAVHRVRLELSAQPLLLPVAGAWQREISGDDVMLSGLALVDPPERALDGIWDLVFEHGKRLARFLYEKTRLHELGVEEALGLAQLSRFRQIPAGRAIYRQEIRRPGDDSIFILLEGAVALQVRVRAAHEIEVERLHPGALFGGLPLLGGAVHAESAVAQSDVRLLEIDGAAFRYLRQAKPWLGYRLAQLLLRVCADRVSRLCTRVRDEL